MRRRIVLTLAEIRYTGKSIGNDIRVEIEVFGAPTRFETKLKPGASVKPNVEIGRAALGEKILAIPIVIRVTERDILFPDTENLNTTFKINPAASFPQRSVFPVDVRESRGFLTKKIARFEIVIEANIARTAKKRIPTANDPRWTGDFRDDPDDILFARLIFGEAENQSRGTKIFVGGSVLNRVSAKAWPGTVKDVILQKGQYDPFREKDSNFRKVIDPLKNVGRSRKAAWKESYDVAWGLLGGSIQNPSKATHFHGKGIDRGWFISNIVPKGRFLKKIDDTSFYWSPN
ncbi:MAG: cell wall hydrolase [Patescibacteria group bacterium]